MFSLVMNPMMMVIILEHPDDRYMRYIPLKPQVSRLYAHLQVLYPSIKRSISSVYITTSTSSVIIIIIIVYKCLLTIITGDPSLRFIRSACTAPLAKRPTDCLRTGPSSCIRRSNALSTSSSLWCSH